MKLFDAQHATRARSDKSFRTSIFKVMRATLSSETVTHNDCVLGSTFVKRPAKYPDVSGSAGHLSPTVPSVFDVLDVATILH